VGDIKTAVSYLGLEMVKMLALSVEMRGSHGATPICPGFSLDAIQDHGLLSARIARRLLGDKIKAQDAFAAAILQDTGLLVLMGRLPDVFRQIVTETQKSGRSIHDVESEILGVTHAEIGAYLLGIWGLPYSIVEAVAHHHTPQRAASSSWDVLGAVHVASHFAGELAFPRSEAHAGAGMVLDLEYLTKLGVVDNLPAWKAIARSEVEAAAAHRS
jgi:HD-like signal output (HDOD) protein